MQVTEAGGYLAKQLATVAMLLDKSMPTLAAIFYTIPHGEGGRWRGLRKTLLFDIICRLAQRVPLTKLVKLDEDICPYLTMLMVDALVQAGDTLVVPASTWIITMIREAFNNMLLKEAGCNYDNYGLVNL